MSYHKIIASPETVQWGRLDAAIPPILTVESADRVELECVTGLAELYRRGERLTMPKLVATARAILPQARIEMIAGIDDAGKCRPTFLSRE